MINRRAPRATASSISSPTPRVVACHGSSRPFVNTSPAAAAISTARLNAATNAQGTLDELYTIAAAVIGGTSLAGGVGTIAGAMLGAIVMQSLNSGMVLLGLDTPLQSIVIGIVLVVAVWLDTVYRARAK